MTKVLLFLPFLLPLVFFPLFPNEYELPKFLFFVISVQLLLIVSIKRIYAQIPLLMHDKILILAGLFILTLLIVDSIGLDPKISFLGSASRYQGFVLMMSLFEYIILMRVYQLEKNVLSKILIPYIYPLLLALSLITLGQFFIHAILHVPIPIYNNRIVATMGNPNFLGGILVMELFFVLLYNKNNATRVSRILFFLFQILIILSLICTRSQSAILALLLGYLAYALLLVRTIYKKLLLLLLIAVALILTMMSLQSDFSIWDNQLRIWPVAAEKILKKPLLGYGQENFQLIYPKNLHYTVDSAHNIFLEIALAGGIPLLILFLLLIFQSLRIHSPRMRILLIVTLLIVQFNPISIAHIVLLWYIIGLTPTKT